MWPAPSSPMMLNPNALDAKPCKPFQPASYKPLLPEHRALNFHKSLDSIPVLCLQKGHCMQPSRGLRFRLGIRLKNSCFRHLLRLRPACLGLYVAKGFEVFGVRWLEGVGPWALKCHCVYCIVSLSAVLTDSDRMMLPKKNSPRPKWNPMLLNACFHSAWLLKPPLTLHFHCLAILQETSLGSGRPCKYLRQMLLQACGTVNAP